MLHKWRWINVFTKITYLISSDIRRLEDAIRKYTLPMRVSVLSADETSHYSLQYIVGKDLTLVEGRGQIFLKANVITDGKTLSK